jgi:hypothetical protein
MEFKPPDETEEDTNFLDLNHSATITATVYIYRKPTSKNATLNFNSNHPIEH